MALTWWGHATVGIELDGVRVLTDPVLRRWIGPLRRTGPVPTASAVTDLDAVLISHGHHDHLDVRSLRQIPRTTKVVVPIGRGALVRAEGFLDVVELAVGASTTIGPFECDAVPAHHTGARWRDGSVSQAQGYLLRGSRTVWFAGDTGAFEALSTLRGRVDVALVPTGGWGPTLGSEHLSAAQAALVCESLEIPVALPIHWGTFAVPGLRMLRPLWRHQEASRFTQLLPTSTRPLVAAPGERVVVPAAWMDGMG